MKYLNFNTILENQIIELSYDKTYENKLKNETIIDFRYAGYNEQPEFSLNVIKRLLLFPIIYLCEKDFQRWLTSKQNNEIDKIHV